MDAYTFILYNTLAYSSTPNDPYSGPLYLTKLNVPSAGWERLPARSLV